MATEQFPSKQESDRIYQQFIKPIEDQHKGQYVLVTSDGQTIFAPTLVEVAKRASEAPSKDNFIFKVGPKAIGKLR